MKTHCPQGHLYDEENTYLNNGSKQCRTCRRERMRLRRPASGIGAGGLNKIKTHCPQGHEYTTENTYTNPQGRRWCRTCARANSVIQHAKQFGLTPEVIQELRDTQNNQCAICKRDFDGPRVMHIDHDHACCPSSKSCGRCVRALLCSQCNQGLGSFRDSITILESAVSYLHQYNKQGTK